MGKQLFIQCLHAGNLGVSDPCGGIAGYPVVSSQLHAIDIILIEFWTSVEIVQVIKTGPNGNASIKNGRTLFDQLN